MKEGCERSSTDQFPGWREKRPIRVSRPKKKYTVEKVGAVMVDLVILVVLVTTAIVAVLVILVPQVTQGHLALAVVQVAQVVRETPVVPQTMAQTILLLMVK